MPWSPIPKFPEIVDDLRQHGYKKQVNFEMLRLSVMRITNLIKSVTIKQAVQAMEDLGYLKKDGAVWLIYSDKLYDFPKK